MGKCDDRKVLDEFPYPVFPTVYGNYLQRTNII
jgi:hypothetical protein